MSATRRTLDEIRSSVCDTTLAWLLGAGLLATALSVARSLESGWLPVITLHMAVIAVIAAAFLFRRRLSLRVRATTIVAVLFAVGVGGHITFGTPYALAYFASSGIMAKVFFGKRGGFAVLFLSIAAIATIYLGITAGVLATPNPFPYAMMPTTWAANAIGLLVTAGGPLIAISELRKHFDTERTNAEAANAAKSDFLAMMSHELRTPMTGILGIADLLQADRLLPHQAAQVALLSKSARALLGLLNEILDFSKIEANMLTVTPVPFSLMELVGDIEALVLPLATDKNIAFCVTYQPDLVDALIGDAVRLRQILINLIGNAIKFTEVGQVTLNISQDRSSGEEIVLCASIIDTGVGISPQHQQRLFQPFVQGDNGVGRRYEGSGLGLVITQRLLKLMGGDISFVSAKGEGSTFSFKLPVRENSGEQSGPEPALAVAPKKGVEGLRVLVVEDNQTTRYLLEIMLSRLGHYVTCVDDGASALQRSQVNEYDVILMDVHMPVMDGLSATRALRGLGGKFEKLPVIGLTADIVSGNRDAYLDAGMNAVVGKPVNWDELLAELQRLSPAKALARSIAAAAKEQSILDEAGYAQLERDLSAEHLARLLPSFRESVAELKSRLADAVAAGDVREIKQAAHALKGVCAQFAATEVRDLAGYLETETTDLSEIQAVMIDLNRALEVLDLNLAARCAGFSHPLSG